jgi:hypothetical protein
MVSGHYWFSGFGEDGHTVVRALPAPDGEISSRLYGGRRERIVGGLELLQADHVWL